MKIIISLTAILLCASSSNHASQSSLTTTSMPFISQATQVEYKIWLKDPNEWYILYILEKIPRHNVDPTGFNLTFTHNKKDLLCQTLKILLQI